MRRAALSAQCPARGTGSAVAARAGVVPGPSPVGFWRASVKSKLAEYNVDSWGRGGY